MNSLTPFHAAYPVGNLDVVKPFYIETLGCNQGREDTTWIDIDLFGHQLVFHYIKGFTLENHFNPVDKHQVPVPHFGCVLEWNIWHSFAKRLTDKNLEFVIEPTIRFEGLVGEQSTMFFYDLNDYALEFKSFKDPKQLFNS